MAGSGEAAPAPLQLAGVQRAAPVRHRLAGAGRLAGQATVNVALGALCLVVLFPILWAVSFRSLAGLGPFRRLFALSHLL